jgi:hypothetical protein
MQNLHLQLIFMQLLKLSKSLSFADIEKMSETTTPFSYLLQFYDSESAPIFAIYVWCVCSFVVLSNSFFILMTLTSSALRKIRANFLLVGFCLADLLHCSSHIVEGAAIWTGSLTNGGTLMLRLAVHARY